MMQLIILWIIPLENMYERVYIAFARKFHHYEQMRSLAPMIEISGKMRHKFYSVFEVFRRCKLLKVTFYQG